MKKNKFPKGWDEERVRRVLAHYEEQTENEAVAEDEAAFQWQRTAGAIGDAVLVATPQRPESRVELARHHADGAGFRPYAPVRNRRSDPCRGARGITRVVKSEDQWCSRR